MASARFCSVQYDELELNPGRALAFKLAFGQGRLHKRVLGIPR